MDFISVTFYLFLAIVVVIYYILPLRFRWLALLGGSLFYFAAITSYRREMIVFLGIIVISWLLGLLQEWFLKKFGFCSQDSVDGIVQKQSVKIIKWGGALPFLRKLIIVISVAAVLFPLALVRFPVILNKAEEILKVHHTGVVISVGLSFFTMQIIAYLIDIYRGKVTAQRNLFKYALFVSFFPQLIQGPIPRYDQLEPQLIKGHKFDDEEFRKGFMLILWGFFLKLVIADKAGVIVDAIFEEYTAYPGAYVVAAGVLYSIQLYADFLACTSLAQGVSELFGIHLADNFRHPYFSTSVKEFWGRWHISLSSWLRDYVYIPLGGNRKGTLRKYFNLFITFIVSGIWHGAGWKYVIWGMMHACYQVIGALTEGVRNRLYCLAGLPKGRRVRTYCKRAFTFFFVMLAWILFRADSLEQGMFMIISIFTVYNPWIFFDDSLLGFGLKWKECMVLVFAVLVLIYVSIQQEKGVVLRNAVLRQPMLVRWAIYIGAIVIVMLFGTYGYGFEASDFIYGNF